MKHTTRLAFIGLAIVGTWALWVTHARAAYDSGNDLLGYCTSKSNVNYGLCLGLVTGYYEGFTLAYECPKANGKVTREQLKDIALKFLLDNPSERHRAAAILVARSYVLAFDCKPSKS